jgi:hypothetical protein
MVFHSVILSKGVQTGNKHNDYTRTAAYCTSPVFNGQFTYALHGAEKAMESYAVSCYNCYVQPVKAAVCMKKEEEVIRKL